MLSRFHLIPERCGRRDRQTDRFAISISRVSMLTRDKKTDPKAGNSVAVGLQTHALLAVRHVTAHPSTTSVPTSYYSMWHYNYLFTLKG